VGDRQQGAAAGGPRCAGGRAAAGRGGRSGRPWPGAVAGRGRPRLPGEAGGGRAPARAGRGGRARPASGASCRGVWAALRHTPGQPQQASGGSREVEHGTAGAAA